MNLSAPPPPPAGRGRFLSLELGRFAAALFVVGGHLATYVPIVAHQPVPRLFDTPQIISVLFFFVLSGFVIESAHGGDVGQPWRIVRYGWRRVCRLFPLYWVSLAVPLYFLWRISPPGYLAQMLSLWPAAVPHPQELNPPAWSLRFELAYYLMFGLLLVRPLRRPLFALWLGGIALHWLMQLFDLFHLLPPLPFAANLDGIAMRFLGVHSFLFLAGVAAAWLHRRLAWPAARLWALAAASALALLALLPWQAWGYGYPPGWLEPFTGGLMSALVFALAGLERCGGLRLPALCAALGALSYPLYIIHASVEFLTGYEIVWAHHRCPPAATLFALMLAATLVSATCLALLDRPFQRLARKLV